MEILVTAFTFAPQVNGVAQVVRVHVEHLIRRGHKVTVATSFDPKRTLKSQANQNPRVVEFNVNGVGNLRSPYQGEKRKYQDFVRSYKGDLLICHCWQSWCTDLAVPCFKELRAKKILISHGFSAHQYPLTVSFPHGLVSWLAWRPYVWRASIVMRQFDRVVFLSELVDRPVYYDHWLAKKKRLRNTCVIPTGVHANDFDSSEADFRAAHGIGSEHVVLCLATYDIHKNQLMALKAFARAGVENAMLVMIGNTFNEYTAVLRKWYERAGGPERAGKVLFLEKLDRTMTRAAFRAADLFLCTSLWESGPLVVLEAMASRTPFVSTDVGFVPTSPGGKVVREEEEMAGASKGLLESEALRHAVATQGGAA